MGAADLTRLAAEALLLALTLAAPVLAVSWVISIATSALQSATQLQDPTLHVVPRLVAGLITLWLTAHWLGARLTHFTSELWHTLPGIAP